MDNDLMVLNSIKLQDPFVSLFNKPDKIINSLSANMEAEGYDDAHPLVVWGVDPETNILVDGHCRFEAAKQAGIDEVPVKVCMFNDENEAIEYAIRNQVDRRNLTEAELLRCIEELDKRKKQGERTDIATDVAAGRSSSQTAEIVGTNRGKVEKARKVIEKGDKKTKEKIESGELTINKAYNDIKDKEKSKTEKRQDRINGDVRDIIKDTKKAADKAMALLPHPYLSSNMQQVLDEVKNTLVDAVTKLQSLLEAE